MRTPVPTPAEAPISHAIRRLAQGESLSVGETADAFGVVVRGEASAPLTAALLMALRVKGETAQEVAGAVRALRTAMVPLLVNADGLVDTCGTGGGAVSTLNVSTAAAFVVAGAGVRVAKHGNRSYTSRSGSADVLEALGVDIALAPDAAAGVLDRVGLVFLFAPTYHPAMRHVAPARRELGVPTIMNLLGPLLNPAGTRRQVVGVADRGRAPVVAGALAELGADHALVVHADVGMDEISPLGATRCWEVRGGGVREWVLDPATLDLAAGELLSLAGAEPAQNAERLEALFLGRSDRAVRCAVLLNAAAALYVSGKGWSLAESATRAAESLDCGAAHQTLTELRRAAPAGDSGTAR